MALKMLPNQHTHEFNIDRINEFIKDQVGLVYYFYAFFVQVQVPIPSTKPGLDYLSLDRSPVSQKSKFQIPSPISSASKTLSQTSSQSPRSQFSQAKSDFSTDIFHHDPSQNYHVNSILLRLTDL